MAPDQFWRLHPAEFWWLVEARRPRKMYGALDEQDVEELYDEFIERGVA